MKKIKENKRIQFALGYGIIHLLFYFILESSDAQIHVLQCRLDNMIPFCEYFIIPYVLWYAFVALTVYYFAVVNERKKEYYQLMISLCLGMFIFGVVSLVYPNGHTLRPVLGDGGIFIEATKLLYTIDTSTNILPSLHVYEAVACCMAILKNRECRMKKWLPQITGILTILIVLSTMFLKQHTVIDVIAALILNFVCYLLVYRWAEKHIDRVSTCETIVYYFHHKKKLL